MSKVTETGFGISFWYPAAWKVTDEPVTDPTPGGWFPGARILKELKIQNPAASEENNQPPGVILDEILAPAGLTELGQSNPRVQWAWTEGISCAAEHTGGCMRNCRTRPTELLLSRNPRKLG